MLSVHSNLVQTFSLPVVSVENQEKPSDQNDFNKLEAFTSIFDSVPDFQRVSESVVKEESRKPEKSVTKSSILHRIAGPPYDEAPVFLPTAATTKVPKIEMKISKEKKRIALIKKQLERLKILERLQKLEAAEKEPEKKDDKEKFLAGILKIPELGDSIDRFSEYFGFNDFGFAGGGYSNMFGHLSLDKPLSKHDFLYEIKHWFRRAIWFLGFTAAYTLSPTILFLTALLALAFELALNIDIARNYYLVHNNRRSDELVPNYDSSNWRYILGLPPDFMLGEPVAEAAPKRNQ